MQSAINSTWGKACDDDGGFYYQFSFLADVLDEFCKSIEYTSPVNQ